METKLTTVGVIGGGQLAWMMAQEAPRLGLKLAVQTPGESDPAVALADKVVLTAIADGEGTRELAEHCGVITFENEFVDLPSLEKLAQQGITFHPRLDALAPLLDKWEQRHFFAKPRFTRTGFLGFGIVARPIARFSLGVKGPSPWL